MPELFVGLMSGTSLDGIDAALVDFSSGISLRHARTTPFEPGLRSALLELIEQHHAVSLDDVGMLDAQLGIAYAVAVRDLLDAAATKPKDVAAVGCHGQTIRHRAETNPAFTWQLGDATRIAALTSLPVVSDFRRMDVALGGQGAPLVPAFHQAAFSHPHEVRAVVNVGGIANITILESTVTGYDIGPGNGLMDAWIQHNRHEAYDHNGSWAASGRIDSALLASFLDDPFFLQSPPRSTGRERFNRQWLLRHLTNREVKPEDVQATLLALTAQSVAQEVRNCNAERVLLCGGGARNLRLHDAIATELGDTPMETTDVHGVDADFVEAAAFAWLARERLAQRTGSLSSVTGASRDAILGAVHLP